MARTSSTQWRTMIFYTKVYSAFFVDKWVPAVTGMAHSDRGWTCGWTGKTVRSLKNTCHTWALLRWWFTTKRRLVYAPLPLRLSILTKTTCVHFLSTSEVMIQYIWRYIKCSHLYLYLYEYVINNNNNNNLPAVLVRLTATLHRLLSGGKIFHLTAHMLPLYLVKHNALFCTNYTNYTDRTRVIPTWTLLRWWFTTYGVISSVHTFTFTFTST